MFEALASTQHSRRHLSILQCARPKVQMHHLCTADGIDDREVTDESNRIMLVCSFIVVSVSGPCVKPGCSCSATCRYLICRKFGAEMHLIAPTTGVTGMLKYVQQQLAIHEDYWTPLQFENPDNPLTHIQTTGPEIWQQTGGVVDFFVAVCNHDRLPRSCRD